MNPSIQAVDHYVDILKLPSPFHSGYFYKHIYLFLQERLLAYVSHAGCASYLFPEFLDLEVLKTHTRSLAMKAQFTMRFVSFIAIFVM